MATLTQIRVKELLRYDPETGHFRWRKPTTNRVKVGSLAGHPDHQHGYRLIGVDGRVYHASRLAFLYMVGHLPDYIDHKNRDRGDDRWENLREATRSQNQMNRGVQSNSSSGLKGAHWHGQSGKWYARITVRGKTHNLGLHHTAKQAHTAYCAAVTELHGEYAAVK